MLLHLFLFLQSLMTGLMYYKPEDHITFLQECLRKVKHEGIDEVKWNIFIESRKKTPLPPIASDGSTSIKRDPSFITGLLIRCSFEFFLPVVFFLVNAPFLTISYLLPVC